MSNQKLSRFVNLVIIFSVILSIIFFPSSVQAALVITSVTPSTISNLQNNTITINGTDFVMGSSVSLEGYGALATSFFSSTTLMAVVPSGIALGTYTVVVTNPDATSASLPNSLNVVLISPTATATQPSSPPTSYERPVLVVNSYSMSQEKIYPGNNFTLYITLYNAGQYYARNVVATFTPGDLLPRETGGVVAVGNIAPENHQDFGQPFFLKTDVWAYVASVTMQLSYADDFGMLYNESFVISLPVNLYSSSAATSTPTPTMSPTPAVKPQLVITSYSSDVDPLQPGLQFNLTMTITNMGVSTARRVTMIVGGGSSASGSEGGTPQPGGVSGASGEFTNFAPIGASNVQSLGDFQPDSTQSAIQPLIVNTSTNPGAYPLKISFTYTDDQNRTFTDDQVITLLVYRLPQVDIDFYQDPNPLFAGQMNMLPLQVVNLGRNSIVLGTMRVSSNTGQLSNNSILVGTLEPGGYFTLDASYMPDMLGPVNLTVSIDYTNDFNQQQIITETLTIEILDQPILEPPIDGGLDGGEIAPPQPETFLQKVWRFILGLLGLDSGVTTPQPSGGEFPAEEVPVEGEPISVPAVPPKGP